MTFEAETGGYFVFKISTCTMKDVLKPIAVASFAYLQLNAVIIDKNIVEFPLNQLDCFAQDHLANGH